jgi:hypothetical protein
MWPRLVWAVILLMLAGTRLANLDVVWVEEGYPSAAAGEMLRGKALYREIWFDKPPLFPAVYMLWGGGIGWPLRLAGILFGLLASVAAWFAARRLWGRREGLLAALLTAFLLCFDTMPAVMALTPDLLSLPLHLAAVGLAAAGQPFAAGAACGIALGFNTKAVLILAACALWQSRNLHKLIAGFALPAGAIVLWLAAAGSLDDHWRQVWAWGARYSADTPFQNPLAEGLRRTFNWLGFRAALVIGAWFALRRETERRRLLAWIAISLAAAWLGLRFFPRYFFHLLPPLALLGARGLATLPRQAAIAIAFLLAVPLIRFAPRYVELARDQIEARPHAWRDLALYEDCRRAAAVIEGGTSLLVWGYRPEIYPLTRMRAATRFLDSQPLNGVLADRHLRDVRPTFPGEAQENRDEVLRGEEPEWIVDGLGPLNPALAVFGPAGLGPWKERYALHSRLATIALYRLR